MDKIVAPVLRPEGIQQNIIIAPNPVFVGMSLVTAGILVILLVWTLLHLILTIWILLQYKRDQLPESRAKTMKKFKRLVYGLVLTGLVIFSWWLLSSFVIKPYSY